MAELKRESGVSKALNAAWVRPFLFLLFIVVAWVALWYPLDTLIYSGRPYRMQKSVLRTMQEMEITVRAAD